MQRYEMLADVGAEALQRFDAIIDARSPGEFAEDHLPGAISLPVLDDAERARIGTQYAQVSPFEARRAGAALVARNVARHLDTALADRPKRFRPLIYCWRGGMRSNAMATILAAVGWKTAVLEGGYRTWRRAVVAGLAEASPALNLVLIDGQTGTGKTALLHALAARGAQMLDLEGLAEHRGSVFGDFAETPQPSQKAFETRLWTRMRGLSPDQPVFVEAESSLIGRRRVPEPLWTAMKAAPRIEVRAPAGERARYLVTAYADLTADRARIAAAIDRLASQHAKDEVERWRDLADAGEDARLAEALITGHYDRAYDRSRRRRPKPARAVVDARDLSPQGLDRAAEAVLNKAAGLAPRAS